VLCSVFLVSHRALVGRFGSQTITEFFFVKSPAPKSVYNTKSSLSAARLLWHIRMKTHEIKTI
jgi:hypothetical protein